MNEDIVITYLDDSIDPYLLNYLREFEAPDEYINLRISDLKFGKEMTYEKLLVNEKIIKSNILIIDSALFENAQVQTDKFTGEEFNLILKKQYPFIEVIVVSRKSIIKNTNIVKKYTRNREREPQYKSFYDQELKLRLDNSIRSVITYRQALLKFEDNTEVNEILLDKLKNLINGINDYNEFTKKDVENLVTEFKKIYETENHE